MKNIILFLSVLSLFLISCGGNEPENLNPIDTQTGGISADDVFKTTGCFPKDPNSIRKLYLFVDSLSNDRYLFGSKEIDGKECFWASKYNSSGTAIWDRVYPDRTYGTLPKMLKNGNIVVAGVISGSNAFYPQEASPVIISAKDGNAKFISVYTGYFYSDITPFDNFFFCSISDRELNLNTSAKKYFVQISNSGEILNQGENMTIPPTNAIFLNNSDFMSITPSIVKRGSVVKNEDIWSFIPQLPKYKFCETDLKIEEDIVIANYKMLCEEDTIKYTYKASYTTGKLLETIIFPRPDYSDFLEFEKEYVASDSMTVIVHRINLLENGEGTTDYTVFYTLKNKTRQLSINEGIIRTYYNSSTIGETQTGSFDKLYPGESRSRSYTFKSISSNRYVYVQYFYDWLNDIPQYRKNVLRWKIP